MVDLAAWQIGAILVAAGVGLLYLSATLEGHHGPNAGDATLREVGALLTVTGALSVFWDLRGRRALMYELLSAAGVSTDLTSAGLTRITTNYIEIDWDGLLNGACHVDLFFAYAQTWRATHIAALRGLVERDDTHLRVVLPDREDQALVSQLATKFDNSEDEIVRKIEGAESDIANLRLQAATSASVDLRCTNEFPVLTYYRFDSRCVGVLYSQVGERVHVPAFECEHGGSLHGFFSGQFDKLWEDGSVRSLGEDQSA